MTLSNTAKCDVSYSSVHAIKERNRLLATGLGIDSGPVKSTIDASTPLYPILVITTSTLQSKIYWVSHIYTQYTLWRHWLEPCLFYSPLLCSFTGFWTTSALYSNSRLDDLLKLLLAYQSFLPSKLFLFRCTALIGSTFYSCKGGEATVLYPTSTYEH